MLYHIIVLRSLTYAQRAVRLLERAGLYASVKKAPQSASSEGCAYGVRVRSGDLARAVKLITANDIDIRRVVDEGKPAGAGEA